MSKNPIEDLGVLFGNEMNRRAQANTGITLELGTISGNMALQVDSLSNAIPKGEYMIALRLTLRQIDAPVSPPEALRGLRAGDRVLVAWIGREPVVIDVVVGS